MYSILVVDDSAIVRKVLVQRLSLLPKISNIFTAPDPYVARNSIINHQPDLIILDIEMPRMDGIEFLEKIMTYMPRPVIILSSLASEKSPLTLSAIKIGAVDVISKPGGPFTVENVIDLLYQRIITTLDNSTKLEKKAVKPSSYPDRKTYYNSFHKTHKILCFGASTGGTQALEKILTQLHSSIPGTLIVQHMPNNFTNTFARRLNSICAFEVKEAQNNDIVCPGRALIAPGGYHMELSQSGALLSIKLTKGPKEHFQRPAVDPLFRSVASIMQQDAMGIILTGMGADGAEGLLEMQKNGARTIAQNEASSVVWGMPKAAIKLNAANEILELSQISSQIIKWSNQNR